MSRRRDAREAALRIADATCPRCAARRGPLQHYCLECGLPLPVLRGALFRLRRSWLRRLGWYPGDFVWLVLLAAVFAAAGGAASVLLGARRDSAHSTTLVATITAPAPGQAPLTASGRTRWPSGQMGWTVVLASWPARGGGTAAARLAVRAVGAGLPEVGVLDSSAYASLPAGYVIVFSGVYGAESDAQAALRSDQARGYDGAYVAPVSP